jgi:hypothetical protein
MDLRNGLASIAEVYSETFKQQEVDSLISNVFRDHQQITIDDFIAVSRFFIPFSSRPCYACCECLESCD